MTTNTQPATSPRTAVDTTTTQGSSADAAVAQALLVGIDGRIDTVDLTPEGGSFGASIRQAIGCRLYAITAVDEHIDMWTDDEGMPDLGDAELVEATLNPLATLLLAEHRAIYQPYFGAALFTGQDGERTVGLGATDLVRLRAAAEAIASRPSQLDAFRRRVIAAVTRQR
ncbi:MAG: DUF3846 domain-containing protein [Mycobacteriaceae bacterium]|jgi:hypothetical protein|nr:DUF3846 domain-containing protein [Mycobacteriaceae bacterium]